MVFCDGGTFLRKVGRLAYTYVVDVGINIRQYDGDDGGIYPSPIATTDVLPPGDGAARGRWGELMN